MAPFCAKLTVQFMDVKLPKLGEGADSGVVVGIFVNVGDTVAKDQPILELENEKAVASIPSTAAGVVEKIHVKAGDKVSIGQKLITLAGGARSGGCRARAKTCRQAGGGQTCGCTGRGRGRERGRNKLPKKHRIPWPRRWRRRRCAGWRASWALI